MGAGMTWCTGFAPRNCMIYWKCSLIRDTPFIGFEGKARARYLGGYLSYFAFCIASTCL